MMGDDPATSVVDAVGRCHDVPNLYVFDGSVWPTSAGMNPTATIRDGAAVRGQVDRGAARRPGGGMNRDLLGALADLLIPAGSGCRPPPRRALRASTSMPFWRRGHLARLWSAPWSR